MVMARRPAEDMPLGPTRAQLAHLVRFYSLREIADRYGVGNKTVHRWCMAFGIRSPRAKAFPIDAA